MPDMTVDRTPPNFFTEKQEVCGTPFSRLPRGSNYVFMMPAYAPIKSEVKTHPERM